MNFIQVYPEAEDIVNITYLRDNKKYTVGSEPAVFCLQVDKFYECNLSRNKLPKCNPL